MVSPFVLACGVAAGVPYQVRFDSTVKPTSNLVVTGHSLILLVVAVLVGCSIITTMNVLGTHFDLAGEYAHYVVASLLFFQALGFVSKKVVRNYAPVPAYMKSPKEVDMFLHECAARIVSSVHAIISVILAVYALQNEAAIHEDHVFAYTHISTLAIVFSCGYFFHDTLDCLIKFDFKHLPFLLHHSMAALIYSFSLVPVMHYWAFIFNLWEISTPFLNVRWIMLKLGKSSSLLHHVNQVIFAISFVGIRIFFGIYNSGRVYMELVPLVKGQSPDPLQHPHYSIQKAVPALCLSIFLVTNIVFNLLNLHWARMIISKLLVLLSGSKKSHSGKRTQKAD